MTDYEKVVVFSDDELHVILDATRELLDQIDREETTPWADYTGGYDDPKSTGDGYLALIGLIDDKVEAALSRPTKGTP